MKDEKENVAQVVGQLYQVKTNKDGGGRIQFDFGYESLKEIQKIQELNGKGEQNFILVIAPYRPEEIT